jgi:hypothetical protein
MEVKGTAVRSIPEFVEKTFPNRKQEWLNALPDSSKKIMDGLLFTNNWYPLNEALTIPMKTISKVFYNSDDIITARTMGRFSADVALSGVYKFFIQIGSPKFIIERGSRIFSTYYQPSEMIVLNVQKNSILVHLTKFPESEIIIEENIAGWMERALEKSGCKNVKVRITKSLSQKQPITEFSITWE